MAHLFECGSHHLLVATSRGNLFERHEGRENDWWVGLAQRLQCLIEAIELVEVVADEGDKEPVGVGVDLDRGEVADAWRIGVKGEGRMNPRRGSEPCALEELDASKDLSDGG